VNTGDDAYKFLAVYPGSAGHDYQWVLDNGMGLRAFRKNNNLDLQEFYS
jgi:glucose-6-phosphate isomerase